MKKEDIQKMADRYQAKADKAFNNYQETGIQRYQAEWLRNEDLSDALRLAANAAEEHNDLICLRGDLADLANKAAKLGKDYGYQESDALIEDILARARYRGLIGGGP